MSNEIDEALVDVKKAYRLIYLYMRSVRDTVEKISQQFNCNFYYWTPTDYEITPRRSTNPFLRWTWDMLPFYNISFLFLSEGSRPDQQNIGDWMLDVYVETDNGYKEEVSNVEPDPTNFIPITDSESTISIQLLRCSQPSNFNWYWDFWNNCDYPENQFDIIKKFHNLYYVGKSYHLKMLFDESSIVTISNDFKKVVQSCIKEMSEF